ncbi:PREDICTED: hemoglobin subunit mu [Galeopterus variegatus]|uniref:Hemoglobin subunit mu n=1 Tax=Galeopterus variegatus TaxID=482537 RepID=A0ABM0S420_GALVR|nr:PREDICTED: hemoglobin subunit mu [Galeopterus variegatus]
MVAYIPKEAGAVAPAPALLAQVWDLIAGHEAHFEAKLLLRCHPSPPRFRGRFTVPRAWPRGGGRGLRHVYDPCAALSRAADLHSRVLRVDPSNFPLLIQCFQMVQGEYTVEMQAAWDKFLTGVAVVLTEKYY